MPRFSIRRPKSPRRGSPLPTRRTPSPSVSPLRPLSPELSRIVAQREVSPVRARIHGKTLSDYRGVVVDFCTLTITLLQMNADRPPPASVMDDFKKLLNAEGIPFQTLKGQEVLSRHTVLLPDAEAMRRFVCKIPQLQTVMRD